MALIKTIAAKDVAPEEIAQVRTFKADLPPFSPLRRFISELLIGLEMGHDMALIYEEPEKNSETV